MKIGNVEISGNLILAPMAGVTDLPFRLLCKEQGADLVYSEMISAKGILYNNKNTKPLLEISPLEKPLSLQLFGSDPDIMAEMAKRIEGLDFDILDINMGCPVPKIVNNGEGSALMKNPELAGRIVESIVNAIKKPVTVKIRKGFLRNENTAVSFAKRLESCGAAAIAVHGRTREQYYSGKADWEVIKDVKEAVNIPVIGNGDIFSKEDAERMLKETGCDGIMIGRGARGNPWIFHQIKYDTEKHNILKSPTHQDLAETILRHAKIQVEWKGEYLGIREMRKHVAWYTSGYPDSSKLRNDVNQIESLKELENLLENWKDKLVFY